MKITVVYINYFSFSMQLRIFYYFCADSLVIMFIEIRKITRCGLLFWLFMGVFPGAQAQELLLGL
ncbi:MAG: hypothetical protein LBR10_02690, partial [Prevotellaceae bacterium]|nr:hypothetical protein [Prevotellaceae bacterium]